MLKSIVACLLDVDSTTLYTRDATRALFVLLQNPIFSSQSTFTILAHLLQHLTGLPNSDHQLLVHWFRNLSLTRFKLILRNLLQVCKIDTVTSIATERFKFYNFFFSLLQLGSFHQQTNHYLH